MHPDGRSIHLPFAWLMIWRRIKSAPCRAASTNAGPCCAWLRSEEDEDEAVTFHKLAQAASSSGLSQSLARRAPTG